VIRFRLRSRLTKRFYGRPDIVAEILSEFIGDVEAAGVATVTRDGPDLAVTCETAPAARRPLRTKRQRNT
jgi:hypothetical protein